MGRNAAWQGRSGRVALAACVAFTAFVSGCVAPPQAMDETTALEATPWYRTKAQAIAEQRASDAGRSYSALAGHNSAVWLGTARVGPWSAGAEDRPMVSFPDGVTLAIRFQLDPRRRATDFRLRMFPAEDFPRPPRPGERWVVCATANAKGVWYIDDARRVVDLVGIVGK